ncbi:MAG: DUF4403 family protein [Saprospiraceae bacterium]
MNNKVNFEITTTSNWLSNAFEVALDHAISGEEMEVNGVKVILTRIGEANVVPNGKIAKIALPIKVEIQRAAGLFTVEGTGALMLNLAVAIDISDKLRLSTHTQLENHNWIERPILELGSLNIPIEKLMDLVLNHHESIITGRIDNSLKSFSDLRSLISKGLESAKNSLTSAMLKGNVIDVNLSNIALHEFVLDNEMVKLNGCIEPQIAINKKLSNVDHIGFEWLKKDEINTETVIEIPVSIPYSIIEKEVVNALKGVDIAGRHFDVFSIKVTGGKMLNIQMELNEPIKAQVFITGVPLFDKSTGILDIKKLDVKVNPANFIYKLTAPMVNKFVEGKMNDFFPLSINQQLNKAVKENLSENIAMPNGNIAVGYTDLELKNIVFDEKEIACDAIINNLDLKMKMG